MDEHGEQEAAIAAPLVGEAQAKGSGSSRKVLDGSGRHRRRKITRGTWQPLQGGTLRGRGCARRAGNTRGGRTAAPARDIQATMSALLRRVRLLWREPDDLDPGAPGNVHRLDHVLVDPVRPRLDEQELGR